MTRSDGRPVRVLILGSCVSRDAFRRADSCATVVGYYARSSLGSAFGNPSRLAVDLERLSSPFQQRMVTADLEKRFVAVLASADFDILLIDVIDEQFHLYVDADGGVATYSAEMSQVLRPDQEWRTVASGSDEFFRRWEAGWSALVRVLDQRGLRGRVRVNTAWWSDRTTQGSAFEPTHSARRIQEANHLLDRLYRRMALDLDASQFYEHSPQALIADELHTWGRSPFHFVEEYFSEVRRALASERVPLVAATPGVGLAADRGPGDGERHVIDAAVPAAVAASLRFSLLLTGWDRIDYVALGHVAGGQYWRSFHEAPTQDAWQSYDLPVSSLRLDDDRHVDGAAGVSAVRVYLKGVASTHGGSIRAAVTLRPAGAGMTSAAESVPVVHTCVGGDRHALDVPLPSTDAAVLCVEVELDGWDDISYVGIGHVAGGTFHRVLPSGLEQRHAYRFEIPVALLVAPGVPGDTGADLDGTAVSQLRVYVHGAPGDGSAQIVVRRAHACTGCAGCAAQWHAEVTADDRIVISGWQERYQVPVIRCESVDDFAPPPGLVAIYEIPWARGALQAMASRRPSSRLAVGFHGAADRHAIDYPYFERVATRRAWSGSFLLFADPTLQLSEDLSLGWYLGTGDADLVEDLVAVVRRMQRVCSSAAVVFSGGSGGGFAALQASARYAGSAALVFAPQTQLARYTPADWARAREAVFPGADDRQIMAEHEDRVSAVSRYRTPGRNLVDYVINQGDPHHVVEHCAPFAAVFGLASTGGTSTDGRVRILPVNLGEGHLPVSRNMFEHYLEAAFGRLEA